MVHFERICGCGDKEIYEARHIPTGVYGDDWDAGFNIRIEGAEAKVSLLRGRWNRKMDRSVEAFVKAMGVKTVIYDRRGKNGHRDKKRRIA